MGIKRELDDFHGDILLLLEFIGEDNYFRRLVGKETLEEYEYLERQVKEFREKLRGLSGHDRKLLELNVSLKMLAFYVHEYVEEIKSKRIPNKKKLASSLSFITKFISQIKDEYVHRIHEKVKETDRELLLLLTQYTQMVYNAKFKNVYQKLGYKRPFLDKFYRDYNLHGIPVKLLSEIVEIARSNSYDVYLCVLKGGLPYTILLELLGIPHRKIKYIFSGRRYEGSTMDKMVIGPVGFDFRELIGKNILFIDNNLATGKSVKEAIAQIKEHNPASVSLFLDYIVTHIAGVNVGNLRKAIDYNLENHHVAQLRKNLLDEEEVERIKLSLIRKLKRRMS
ncbi:MAG: phosphoribosyltransferase [Nanoarchaeota archaeon]|nr:phosphoribosyltransferase [Nanoarchaeota archaeon]